MSVGPRFPGTGGEDVAGVIIATKIWRSSEEEVVFMLPKRRLPLDEWRVFVSTIEEEKTCLNTPEKMKKALGDAIFDGGAVFLVWSDVSQLVLGRRGALWHDWGIRYISIPDSVEEICDECFCRCRSLARVTFGQASSLKRIGVKAFKACAQLTEIQVPSSVEELCDKCFFECKSISRVTFVQAPLVKQIGVKAFGGCESLTEIHVPDGVENILAKCFCECKSLSVVTFGESSSLKRIGMEAFSGCSLTEICIPESVEELCDECFSCCRSLLGVTFGKSLNRIGRRAFTECGVTEINIPDGVEELCEQHKQLFQDLQRRLDELESEKMRSETEWRDSVPRQIQSLERKLVSWASL